MRKLVTIRQVREIRPIEGADKIELALIDGWQCVIKKGELKQGEPCVYFEIDSFCPIRPEFEFLRKSSLRKMGDGTQGFRLKTIKLRGQWSQGLAMPLSEFPDLAGAKIGDDVTEKLGVLKYEAPVPANLSGIAKGKFPSFISKTDEERIQNLSEWFELYKDVEFECTEKLDGSSMSVYWRDGEHGVCSRNLDLQEDDGNTLWNIAKRLRILEALKAYKEKLGNNLAIQGECVGESINKNPYKLLGQTLFVFNIYDIDSQRYLTPDERNRCLDDMRALGFTLEQVPHVASNDGAVLKGATADSLLVLARGKSALNPAEEREGFVYKSRTIIGGNIISFKVINNEYLLNEKD